MQAVLCLVALYYGVLMMKFIMGLKKELAEMGDTDAEKAAKAKKDDGAGEPLTATDGSKDDGKKDTAAEAVKAMNNIIKEAEDVTINIPMIAILIVFARLRAKVDLEGTNPTAVCRQAFFGVVGVIYTQAFFMFIYGCLKSNMGESTALVYFNAIMKFLLQAALYTCIGVIFSSIMTMTKTASE